MGRVGGAVQLYVSKISDEEIHDRIRRKLLGLYAYEENA
jgi:hypothetical protein